MLFLDMFCGLPQAGAEQASRRRRARRARQTSGGSPEVSSASTTDGCCLTGSGRMASAPGSPRNPFVWPAASGESSSTGETIELRASSPKPDFRSGRLERARAEAQRRAAAQVPSNRALVGPQVSEPGDSLVEQPASNKRSTVIVTDISELPSVEDGAAPSDELLEPAPLQLTAPNDMERMKRLFSSGKMSLDVKRAAAAKSRGFLASFGRRPRVGSEAVPASADVEPPKPAIKAMISYCKSEAKAYAIRLKQALVQHNFEVYLDEDEIRLGSDWQDSLFEAIKQCDVFVALVTPSYGTTKWTSRELKVADQKGKHIVPINFHFSAEWPPEWLMHFSTVQYVDWQPELIHESLHRASLLERRGKARQVQNAFRNPRRPAPWAPEYICRVAQKIRFDLERLQADARFASSSASSNCFGPDQLSSRECGSPPAGYGAACPCCQLDLQSSDPTVYPWPVYDYYPLQPPPYALAGCEPPTLAIAEQQLYLRAHDSPGGARPYQVTQQQAPAQIDAPPAALDRPADQVSRRKRPKLLGLKKSLLSLFKPLIGKGGGGGGSAKRRSAEPAMVEPTVEGGGKLYNN